MARRRLIAEARVSEETDDDGRVWTVRSLSDSFGYYDELETTEIDLSVEV